MAVAHQIQLAVWKMTFQRYIKVMVMECYEYVAVFILSSTFVLANKSLSIFQVHCHIETSVSHSVTSARWLLDRSKQHCGRIPTMIMRPHDTQPMTTGPWMQTWSFIQWIHTYFLDFLIPIHPIVRTVMSHSISGLSPGFSTPCGLDKGLSEGYPYKKWFITSFPFNWPYIGYIMISV